MSFPSLIQISFCVLWENWNPLKGCGLWKQMELLRCIVRGKFTGSLCPICISGTPPPPLNHLWSKGKAERNVLFLITRIMSVSILSCETPCQWGRKCHKIKNLELNLLWWLFLNLCLLSLTYWVNIVVHASGRFVTLFHKFSHWVFEVPILLHIPYILHISTIWELSHFSI